VTDKITFYHNPQSRGRIVHWMLEEANAPYEVKVVDFQLQEHKAPEYLAINPMGKIPAIVHRGTVVTESAAICAYLADVFPAAELAPAPNDPKRGSYLRWLFFGAGCVEPAVIDRLFSRPPPSRPAAMGYGNYDDTINTLEKALRGLSRAYRAAPCVSARHGAERGAHAKK
jgi:glutathione S-transferase